MVVYKGREPSVKIGIKLYEKVRVLFSESDSTMTVFSKIKKFGDVYKIEELHVPIQSVSVGHNIIQQEELAELGENGLIGIIRGGKGTTRSELKDSAKFYEATTNGLRNFVCISISPFGYISANISDGNVLFEDVSVHISTESSDRKIREKAKDEILSNISMWIGADGYTPTIRKKATPSLIVVDNVKWRDIV